jgi:hypothetical protein
MKIKRDPAKYPCFNTSLKDLKGEQWREIPTPKVTIRFQTAGGSRPWRELLNEMDIFGI